ncbi:hypothetical protein [Vulcanisaeta sp. JCM 14467]|uniref:hypothetical protein n=1 Tax=Vulcanisaeta sp. JCM 14467 TaxID=1295370 RepID=UPI0006D0B1D3|nr:hypothetical protein [Vulcanisaeta sp. JCM 14467]
MGSGMGLWLNVPQEPTELKRRLKQMREVLCHDDPDNASCENRVIWSSNDIPRYLWNEWKDILKNHGYTWQRFLSVLKLASGDLILWALKDSLTWDELVKRIMKLLETYMGG